MHIPVLLKEVTDGLAITANDIVLDGTIGFGGHAQAIINNLSPQGIYLGLDQDQTAVNHCQELFKNHTNVQIVQKNYSQFPLVLKKLGITKINKVLVDLGISSYQLDLSGRGFTYSKDEPLDMRMANSGAGAIPRERSAVHILATYPKAELERIFKNYGELFNCQKFVQNILDIRRQKRIATTFDLIEIIKKSFFFKNQRFLYLKTCAQVFQALRIEVNQELNNLNLFLEQLPNHLAPNARVAIISFHSLEDRMVKEFTKKNKNFEPIFKKVITATQTEIRQNTRAKSAKLRLLLMSNSLAL